MNPPRIINDGWVAFFVFVTVTSATLLFSSAQGIHRDEAYYMDAGERYVTYYEHLVEGKLKKPFAKKTLHPYWSYNHEHPPFLKLLYGISWRALHECNCAQHPREHPSVARIWTGKHTTFGALSETTAFRLPTMVLFGLLCALLYLFYVQALGSRLGGLVAALLMFAQPRAFFHAQTASFDLPAATLWFATMFAYWRAIRTGRTEQAIWTGVIFGLFLATKLQSFFLPIALGLHWLWLAIRRRRAGVFRQSIKPLLAMGAIGPLVMFVLWPWLWHDTFDRFGAYLSFHWKHVHYNFEYLGQNYSHGPYPWHEPLGMLLFTAPVVLLVLAASGMWLLGRAGVDTLLGKRSPDPRATGVMMLLCGVFPIALFVRGSVPIFGATKHWLAVMPYLALCGAYAFEHLASGVLTELRLRTRSLLRTGVLVTLVLVIAAPALVETVRSHPVGLSHYNALAGGARGGADLGMNRQFWGYSVSGVLPWLNEELPAQSKLYLHDWNHDAYQIYRRELRLRPDIHDAGMEMPGVSRSNAAIVVHEKHFNKYDYMIWKAYGHLQPTYVLTIDGVPLVSVYLRDRKKRP